MDLTTNYLGLELRNPLVASASPLSNTIAGIRQLADAGVGAVVLYSLFEEQLRRDAEHHAVLTQAGTESFAEALSYFPSGMDTDGDGGLRRYVSLVERAVRAVDVPVIASLNGITAGAWTDFATALEQAGAAAIELNVFHPLGTPLLPGRDVEQRYLEMLMTVKAVVSVPVAVKLHPYFSSMAEMAHRLDGAGADGLVLFNRFMQPDIDPETLKATSWIGLSTPSEARLPRAWIALLAGRVRASLAASTGVESAVDVVKYLLAGADVVMTTSALLRHGTDHAQTLLDGLTGWMSRKGFADVARVRGLLSVPAGHNESVHERAGYVSSMLEADLGYGAW
ncbi:MAG TPA: dihydroorotate dehydrogenase-like protein [Streptosporangiaceae bacterium]|nr:dihydroorotate dehydrogenase-like protein [Streptosporangiaceae bacterium]